MGDMTTSGVTSSSSSNQLLNTKMKLGTMDFIKMMVTQLQNQDPMEPMKNQELLAQMSQIGQLQTANDLQESMKGLVLQNQIGSAGNLIGKQVKGADEKGQEIAGVVSSIRVQNGSVLLELENGKSVGLDRVTLIAAAPAATKAAA
jgi:flagellar basal-body rod modification protein FlgD